MADTGKEEIQLSDVINEKTIRAAENLLDVPYDFAKPPTKVALASLLMQQKMAQDLQDILAELRKLNASREG